MVYVMADNRDRDIEVCRLTGLSRQHLRGNLVRRDLQSVRKFFFLLSLFASVQQL